MRRRVRQVLRPAALWLLLLGIVAGRVAQGFPFDTLTSFERVVTHPSQHLEGGVHAVTDLPRRLPVAKRRRGISPAMDDHFFQGSVFRLKKSDIASTISDSGGSLQLLLLLALCVAVLCCASMSLSPLYKSENHFPRKAVAALYAVAAFVSDGVTKRRGHQQGCDEDHNQSPAADKRRQGHIDKAGRRSSKAKKRKGLQQPSVMHPILHNEYRTIEKAASSGTSSVCEVSSVVSGDTEGDSPAREEQENIHITPADLQIARLEAEAARQSTYRAAKVKRLPKKQAEPLQSESLQPKKSEVQQIQQDSIGKSGRVGSTAACEAGTKQCRRKTVASGSSVKVSAKSVAALETLQDARERPLSLQSTAAAALGGTQMQVLVVPRKPSLKGKDRKVLSEEEEALLGPSTPQRVASTPGSTFSSPQSGNSSSNSSPFQHTRPYVQVVRDYVIPQQQLRTEQLALPPPPPPARLAALPQSSVYAREFKPAGQSASKALSATAPVFSPKVKLVPINASQPPPAHVAFLQIHSADEANPTTSPLPSPFPGMSLHRRLVTPHIPAEVNCAPEFVPPSFPVTNMGVSACSSTTVGFPGVFDKIWSTSAVGGDSSWLTREAASASLDTGKSLFSSLEEPVVARQDSW